ncbi:hypothetical protein ABPG75_010654 [Micractinium tetrahymenae]
MAALTQRWVGVGVGQGGQDCQQQAGLLLLLAAQPTSAQTAEGEGASLAEIASHDGEIFFAGAVRKTIPPNATAMTPQSAVPCPCSDAIPRNTPAGVPPPYLVTSDCFAIAAFGNCNASFMSSFLAELVFNDGFCQISCGRCPCCVAPAAALQKLGATRFLQASAASHWGQDALQVAQPSLLDLLARPGWAGTLLVPTDAAWDAALAQYGPALQSPALLQQVLKFHMLPPEPRTRGLWTTPFMSVGAKLWTSWDGPAPITASAAPLPPGTTAYGGLTGLRLQGPVNSATVVGPSDIMACKAYLTVIDTVLLPFDPASPALAAAATDSGSALAAAVGAAPGQCVLQASAHFNGTVLQDGTGNRQHTVGDCCASCAKAAGCNAFQYCTLKGGCRLLDGTSRPFGSCQLYHDDAVAAGQPPVWVDYNGTTPLISGYVPSVAAASGSG